MQAEFSIFAHIRTWHQRNCNWDWDHIESELSCGLKLQLPKAWFQTVLIAAERYKIISELSCSWQLATSDAKQHHTKKPLIIFTSPIATEIWHIASCVWNSDGIGDCWHDYGVFVKPTPTLQTIRAKLLHVHLDIPCVWSLITFRKFHAMIHAISIGWHWILVATNLKGYKPRPCILWHDRDMCPSTLMHSTQQFSRQCTIAL